MRARVSLVILSWAFILRDASRNVSLNEMPDDPGQDTRFNMNTNFTFDSATFASEFAKFVNFLGAENLDSALAKVGQKLSQLPKSVRSLYGDRYFLHEQCVRIVHGSYPFQLDHENFVAVRAANFIAGVNRAQTYLSPSGKLRLRSMCLDNLKPDRDIRQLEHEIRCLIHFGQKGREVSFADLEGKARFDLVCDAKAQNSFEVECKTLTRDTGSQIKVEMTVGLASTFYRSVHEGMAVNKSGIYVLTLKKPADQCRNLIVALKSALNRNANAEFENDDFFLQFEERQTWAEYAYNNDWRGLEALALSDDRIGDRARIVTRAGDCVVGLVLVPHKEGALGEKVVSVLKDAADQCSKSKAAILWLHFVGMTEKTFLEIAQFAMDSKGGGLNALVAKAIYSKSSPTDRSHVHLIRFSGDPAELEKKPVLNSDRLLSQTSSIRGFCYDVPNPNCRFPLTGDF